VHPAVTSAERIETGADSSGAIGGGLPGVIAKYVAAPLITMSTINDPPRLLSEVHRRTAAAPPTSPPKPPKR
jgi:hypothetical protein